MLIGKSQTLVIEAGVKLSELKKAVDFDISKITGCIITHEHKDHAGYVKEFTKNGIECFLSAGTLNEVNVHYNTTSLSPLKEYKIGEFTILPFPIQHDASEPFGFLIYHHECGKVLFATDTYYLKYKFSGLNNILIEANYDEDILTHKYISGIIHPSVYNRVKKSHMSINQCIDTLMSNDLTNVNNIVLIHLSEGNGNACEFNEKVSGITGKQVHIASKNIEIEFNKSIV